MLFLCFHGFCHKGIWNGWNEVLKELLPWRLLTQSCYFKVLLLTVHLNDIMMCRLICNKSIWNVGVHFSLCMRVVEQFWYSLEEVHNLFSRRGTLRIGRDWLSPPPADPSWPGLVAEAVQPLQQCAGHHQWVRNWGWCVGVSLLDLERSSPKMVEYGETESFHLDLALLLEELRPAVCDSLFSYELYSHWYLTFFLN